MESAAPVPAAIYCRISLAAMGDTTKVDDQEEKCREVCRRRGWTVAEGAVFKDNSKSAWKRNRKRPGWDAMLEATRAGRFGAIVSYWGDRIVRQPRDLEDLLDLREVRSITLASVAGQYDFDNPDHRMMMRWEVARACNESDTISRRVTEHHARRHARGLIRPGGPRCFGFERDGVTHREAECDAIREMAAQLLGGRSSRSVARELATAGLRGTGGGKMSGSDMSRMLARPRIAGLMPDGETKAAWEPVLGRETWERLRMVLDGRSASNPAPTNARRWLLSGIAACGQCGEPLAITANGGAPGRPGRPAYSCHLKGCGRVTRNAALLDRYVTTRLWHRLQNAANPASRIPQRPDGAREWKALAAERAEIEALVSSYASPGRLRLLMARLDKVDARIAELREQEAGNARQFMLSSYAGISLEELESAPLEVRRSLVAHYFSVRVLPASGMGPGFRTEDVEVVPVR